MYMSVIAASASRDKKRAGHVKCGRTRVAHGHAAPARASSTKQATANRHMDHVRASHACAFAMTHIWTMFGHGTVCPAGSHRFVTSSTAESLSRRSRGCRCWRPPLHFHGAFRAPHRAAPTRHTVFIAVRHACIADLVPNERLSRDERRTTNDDCYLVLFSWLESSSNTLR